ncbi:hypothetical protein BGW38_010014 [Lunasporangiospora selenospora]|uniref:Uncharacterized protein n=1 Tax=Lunasporangiospora selenospora TaxID=979761 RepID=A0A9P6FX98_9FUNG|nr:hypothetical protein BGW38_010014 [Lunasporangiospora selenospora]
MASKNHRTVIPIKLDLTHPDLSLFLKHTDSNSEQDQEQFNGESSLDHDQHYDHSWYHQQIQEAIYQSQVQQQQQQHIQLTTYQQQQAQLTTYQQQQAQMTTYQQQQQAQLITFHQQHAQTAAFQRQSLVEAYQQQVLAEAYQKQVAEAHQEQLAQMAVRQRQPTVTLQSNTWTEAVNQTPFYAAEHHIQGKTSASTANLGHTRVEAITT